MLNSEIMSFSIYHIRFLHKVRLKAKENLNVFKHRPNYYKKIKTNFYFTYNFSDISKLKLQVITVFIIQSPIWSFLSWALLGHLPNQHSPIVYPFISVILWWDLSLPPYSTTFMCKKFQMQDQNVNLQVHWVAQNLESSLAFSPMILQSGSLFFLRNFITTSYNSCEADLPILFPR